jgi:predicted DNA-binding transcriptional regulator AlpA
VALDPCRPTVRAEKRPTLIDAFDLAVRLDVSAGQIHRMKARGDLPKEIRLGGCVRWDPEVIERWIAAGCPDRKTWESIEKRREMLSLVPGAAEPRVVSETAADYFQAGFLL